jgi:hypothetical protein
MRRLFRPLEKCADPSILTVDAYVSSSLWVVKIFFGIRPFVARDISIVIWLLEFCYSV